MRLLPGSSSEQNSQDTDIEVAGHIVVPEVGDTFR